jgi:hypothetical protein
MPKSARPPCSALCQAGTEFLRFYLDELQASKYEDTALCKTNFSVTDQLLLLEFKRYLFLYKNETN